MSSIDLRASNTYPLVKNFSAVQTWTEVSIPSKGQIVTVGCEQHDIYISFTGTQGGGTSGVDKIFIKSGGFFAIKIGQGSNQHDKL